MRVQVLSQSKTNPLIFIVMSSGKAREYTFRDDTAPDVLKDIRAAAKRRETIDIDIVDLVGYRTVGGT